MRERLYWNNQDSKDFLAKGYLLEGETTEMAIERIANRVEHYHGDKRPGIGERVKHHIEAGNFSLSSPVFANFGVDSTIRKGLPISCFGNRVGDSIPDIKDSLDETIMESYLGGGTSTYWGKVRGRGSNITGGSVSEGSFSFLPMFEEAIKTISQGGVRRGHMAFYQDISHPDVEEWLDIQSEGNPIQVMTYGICVSDDWLEKMKAGDDHKRELWAKVLDSREKRGLPYLFFTDNVNKNKPEVYKIKQRHIEASNLCVAPYTQILTDGGYQEIGQLENQLVKVWNGEEWSEVQVIKTGSEQELVKVTTNSGYELDCTPYHKFYVQKDYSRGKVVEVRAKDLKPNDKLIKFDLPVIQGDLELTNAYQNGFYSGDGCLTHQGQRIYLYGEKKKLIDNFNTITNWVNQPDHDRMYGHTDKLKDKFFIPNSDYTIKSRLDWLAGYLDADGTVTNNNGSQSLQIACVELGFLKEVQLMLQTLGCDSKITLYREEGEYLLPKNDGSGDLGLYQCKEINRLLINGNSLYKLSQLGLKCNRLEWEIQKPNRECSQFIKIKSVETIEGKFDTYCFTEPKRHMGMFNGILTGQCTEIMLPYADDESFVCCLSSMNLENYDDWKDTDAVEAIVYLLDAVISEYIEKASQFADLYKTVNFSHRHRAIGIGALGWHSYLQKKSIPFDDIQSVFLTGDIFKDIQAQATKVSQDMVQVYGYDRPEIFDGTDIYMRHATLTAIAPTKSSSFILGQTSAGIEPFESNYFVKDLAKGKTTYKNPYLTKVLEKYEKDTPETWNSILVNFGSVQHLDFLTQHERDVFKTFSEISQMTIIQQAHVRQNHLCQGQSINLKILPSTPVREINNLYLTAHELGIKSLYYQYSINAAQAKFAKVGCSVCEA